MHTTPSSSLVFFTDLRCCLRNGKTVGITRPSSDRQEGAIRSAYAKAGLDFASTSYFECQGTGTAIGDPLEIAAIGRIFASNYSAEDPLLIGSVTPP